MSTSTAAGQNPARAASLTARVRSAMRDLAGRAHARGDTYAQAMGWTVTVTHGVLGLDGRNYRDARFTTLRPASDRATRERLPA